MNENNNRPLIIRRRRIGFFGTWLIIGLIMMLLNATVWPELSTSDSTRWFYDVATMWVTTLNHIFKFIIPVMETARNWLIEFAEKAITWTSSNWPTIIATLKGIGIWAFRIWAYGTVYLTFMMFLAFAYLVIMFFVDKAEAKKAWEEFKQIIRDEFGNFRSKISKTPEPAAPEEKDIDIDAGPAATTGEAAGGNNI